MLYMNTLLLHEICCSSDVFYFMEPRVCALGIIIFLNDLLHSPSVYMALKCLDHHPSLKVTMWLH